MDIPFIKMHGLGNDFAVFDARRAPLAFTREQARRIADRRFGIGCDQVIVLELIPALAAGSGPHFDPDPAVRRGLADIFMRIYNADGGEVASCGNATRCVAALLMEETGRDSATIETRAGQLVCERAGQGRVRVDMGAPKFGWRDIPLARECDTQDIRDPGFGIQASGMAASMGNPHIVFVVDDAAGVDLQTLGPRIEHHKLFPERVNASFAQLTGKDKITLRVWERGAGATLACGTAACAAFAVLERKGLVGRKAEVALPGGTLTMELDAQNHVVMTGEAVRVFDGVWHIPAERRGLVST